MMTLRSKGSYQEHRRHAAFLRAITSSVHLNCGSEHLNSAPCLRAVLAALAISFADCFAFAYDVSLTPAALHDAYILGQRNDQSTASFLSPYLKQLAEKSRAPHIAEIQILTPFAQVVDLSRRFTSGYTEEQALREYRERGDTFVVRILLLLPAAFPKPEAPAAPPAHAKRSSPSQTSALKPENFWQNFRFDIKQHGKTIATRFIRNTPVYSTPTKDTPAVLDGAAVWLEYDAKDVASEETLIEVLTTESKTITATFDLKSLR